MGSAANSRFRAPTTTYPTATTTATTTATAIAPATAAATTTTTATTTTATTTTSGKPTSGILNHESKRQTERWTSGSTGNEISIPSSFEICLLKSINTPLLKPREEIHIAASLAPFF